MVGHTLYPCRFLRVKEINLPLSRLCPVTFGGIESKRERCEFFSAFFVPALGSLMEGRDVDGGP